MLELGSLSLHGGQWGERAGGQWLCPPVCRHSGKCFAQARPPSQQVSRWDGSIVHAALMRSGAQGGLGPEEMRWGPSSSSLCLLTARPGSGFGTALGSSSGSASGISWWGLGTRDPAPCPPTSIPSPCHCCLLLSAPSGRDSACPAARPPSQALAGGTWEASPGCLSPLLEPVSLAPPSGLPARGDSG